VENIKENKPMSITRRYQEIHTGLKGGLGLLILLAITSCGSARRSEPIRGPLSMDEQVKRGQVIFMHHCHKCHPGGEAGLGPSINNIPLPGGLLKFRVRSRAFFFGIGRMPSFKKHEISKAELADLVRYLKALQKHGKAGRSLG
jgi:mono/diheme cytochrome c family protein